MENKVRRYFLELKDSDFQDFNYKISEPYTNWVVSQFPLSRTPPLWQYRFWSIQTGEQKIRKVFA